MDQKKIGVFIAKCRKEKNMTQMQLAELLDITSQAISKWENGRGMPEVSLLQPLCDVLDISLNELFTGERISEEEYKIKAEKNISNLFKEKQIADCKPVRNVFSMCVNATLVVAISEIIIGIIGYFFNEKILEVMLLNASVWFVLALISFGKVLYDKNKFKVLKYSGICVVGCEINEIIPASWIRIGNYHTCRVVCNYTYDGNVYKAVSNYHVVSPFLQKESLYANVYFEKNNPNIYSVELLQIDA